MFDFLSNGTTEAIINDKQAGIIAGADFQQALISAWLGKKPADKGLKQSLLAH